MIRYEDLVEYTKRNHIKWSTDLFDVLRGFFEEYSQHTPLKAMPEVESSQTVSYQQELIFEHQKFSEPSDGEYTSDDLLNLFST